MIIYGFFWKIKCTSVESGWHTIHKYHSKPHIFFEWVTVPLSSSLMKIIWITIKITFLSSSSASRLKTNLFFSNISKKSKISVYLDLIFFTSPPFHLLSNPSTKRNDRVRFVNFSQVSFQNFKCKFALQIRSKCF